MNRLVPTDIVDTHLHLWDPSVLDYPWLEDVPLLNKPYLIDGYDVATSGWPISQMVFVQCEVSQAAYRDELSWVLRIADADPRIAGIVPWAPLELGGGVGDVLAEMAEDARVKGIRRIIQFEEDASFCLKPDFVVGVKLLADCGLHFEICLKGDDQFRNCLELVARCPDTRFILNHIGKPYIGDQRMSPWSELLGELAAMPHVWCKVSGMANEADMSSWQRDDLQTYFEQVVDVFGWNRVVFGGDWPVALLATTYDRWVDTLIDMATATGATQQQVAGLFAENARDFYRLRGPVA